MTFLSRYEDQDPYELRLPDDEAFSVLRLCNMLYHNNVVFPDIVFVKGTSPSSTRLNLKVCMQNLGPFQEFVALCDKYDVIALCSRTTTHTMVNLCLTADAIENLDLANEVIELPGLLEIDGLEDPYYKETIRNRVQPNCLYRLLLTACETAYVFDDERNFSHITKILLRMCRPDRWPLLKTLIAKFVDRLPESFTGKSN